MWYGEANQGNIVSANGGYGLQSRKPGYDERASSMDAMAYTSVQATNPLRESKLIERKSSFGHLYT